MNTLRVWENKPNITSTKLIPNDAIIKLIRISILWLYPENEKKSDKYDMELRETFSKSFSDALDKFSQNLKEKRQKECILMDEFGELHTDFYQTVEGFINPPITHRAEFRDEFCSCFQKQVLGGSIILEDMEIHMEDCGSIVLSLQEAPKPKRISLVQKNTSEALRNLSV